MKFKLRKRTAIAAIIVAILFIASLIAGIVVSVSFIPKNTEIVCADGTRITSVATSGFRDGAYYSTFGGKIYGTDDDGDETDCFDLEEFSVNTYGTQVGHISSVFTVTGFDGLFAVGGDNYLYRFLTEGGLSFKERVRLSGSFVTATYGDGTLYCLTKSNAYYTIFKYDASEISAGCTEKGFVYLSDGLTSKVKTAAGDESVALTLAKGLYVTSMTIKDGYLYLIHTGGLIRMKDDFALNRYGYDRPDGFYENGGLQIGSDGSIYIDPEYFDSSDYACFFNSFGGSCYVGDADTFYFITPENAVVSAKRDYIDERCGKMGVKVGNLKTEDTGVELSESPADYTDALIFDLATDMGYVRHKNSSRITAIDFSGMKVAFVAQAEFDISYMATDKSGENLYIVYHNVNETSSSETKVVKKLEVGKQIKSGFYRSLRTVLFVLAAVTFLTALVLILCAASDKVSAYTADVLKGFVKNKWIYLILLVCLVLLCAFCYYPGVASMVLSLFDYTQQKPTMIWNNFKNYSEIFAGAYAAEAFRNMGIFLVADIVLALVPPVLFAFFLTVMRNKGYSSLTRMLLFIPGIVPSVATLLIWKTGIYGESGVLNTLLGALGLEKVKFLTSSSAALPSLIMMGFPFVGSYLIFYGGMMNIPDSYYEAAELEGCGPWKRLFTIDIPLIRPQLKYVFITIFIASVQNFGRTYMVTSGDWGTQTPINLMYNYMVNGKYGLAAAYATVIFAFLAVVTVINLRSQLKSDLGGE